MTEDAATAVVLLALVLAGAIFLRWRQHRGTAAVPGSPGAPPGSTVVPLGQYSVAPGDAWLLLKQGQ
jgi:hypothetical protein